MSKLGPHWDWIADGALTTLNVALLSFGVWVYGLAFLTLSGHLLVLALVLLALLRVKLTREEYGPREDLA